MNRRRFFSSGHGININNYMTVVSRGTNLTVSFTNPLEYCIDGSGEWVSLPASTETPPINVGHTISFRAHLTPVDINTGIGTFTISTYCNLVGNCMSLLLGDNDDDIRSLSSYNYAFAHLFEGCSKIIECANGFLPAVTLSKGCYYHMFDNCTSLVSAPVLPATTLKSQCYGYMFYGCSALVTAPDLPATTLDAYCYNVMFGSCTSLVKAPSLPATVLKNFCYYGMFDNCTSLVYAPVLPADRLVAYCYTMMLSNCTALSYIKMLATSTASSLAASNWVQNVASEGTFVKHPDNTFMSTGISGIPSGWTVKTATS